MLSNDEKMSNIRPMPLKFSFILLMDNNIKKQEQSKFINMAKPFIEKGDIQGAKCFLEKYLQEQMKQHQDNVSRQEHLNNDIKSKIYTDIAIAQQKINANFSRNMTEE